MDKKNIILITIIVLIVVAIFLIFSIKNLENRSESRSGYKFIDKQVRLTKSLEPVKVRNSYYVVEKCLNRFYGHYKKLFNPYIYNINDEDSASIEKNMSVNIYNMLDKDYINEKKITTDNIKTKLSEIGDCLVDITEMYVSQKENNIEVYLIKGILREKSTGNMKEFYVMMKIDVLNSTFSIFPQEYVEEKYPNIIIGKEIQLENIESIEENKSNTFKYVAISDETYINDMFDKFKNEIQYYKDIAYNKLNKEYKDKKFVTFERFETYIKNNMIRYSNMQLEKYQKTVSDNYTQYVCIDKNGNYYVFRETSPFNYTVILDIYTVDLPEFLEKYNSSTVQEKVALNIDRFMQAMNDKSYYYAYNCLADSYKNNYFKSQEEFENYAKQNFYESSKIEFKEFNEEGDVYTYSVILTDEATGEKMDKTFIVKLGQGTEFVLSFNK